MNSSAPDSHGTRSNPVAAETPFEWIGGEERVRALTERFYDLMDLEPAYAELRATHGSTLDEARQKLFWFLCGWLGGPDHYQSRFGHPRLRARHMPFAIGIKERDQWVACMDQAIARRACPKICGCGCAKASWARPIGCATRGREEWRLFAIKYIAISRCNEKS